MIVNCKNQISPYIQREGITTTYLNDIRKYPILTKEEQRKLLEKTKSTNEQVRKKAIEKLVNCNQRFVMSAAMKATDGNDLLDLVNEANIGLLTAIERFDLKKDVKFITYAAFWIQKSINHYLTEYRNMVIPANAHRLRVTVSKAKNDFFKKEERMPTLEELQSILKEEYNFNVTQISELETYQSVSIDDSNNDDDDIVNENLYYVKATASNNINVDMEEMDMKTMAMKLLNKLSEKDRNIIMKAFGIGCMEKTYESIADEYDLSKERIRQKVNEIIEKLRKMMKNYNVFEN